MSFDTIDENRNRQILAEYDEIWLFGYGSLIYKVDFPYIDSRPALVKGWKRRFWQGSHDHRGTPDNPGRVATLIEDEESLCRGVAYQVSTDVFEHLDHREKNGYLRYEIELFLSTKFNVTNSQNVKIKRGLVYIAPTDNAAFLGAISEKEIAKQIFRCSGPSGLNKEYVYLLADALRSMNEDDEHVFKIEKYLKSFEV